MIIESPDSPLPAAAGFLLDLLVAHAGDFRVVARRCCACGRRSPGIGARRMRDRFCCGLFYDVGAGGGIGFARLSHASANEALEILLLWHVILLWLHHGTLPSSAPW